MIIQVLACSISPSDIIIVHGNLIFMHEALPFIPGMDVCGVVHDPNGHDSKFRTGDVIVASPNGLVSPTGGMDEYMAIAVSEAVLKPPTVNATVVPVPLVRPEMPSWTMFRKVIAC
jgi:NADPH:quinone reductase-like Zn-dependent oxidoreductase